MFGKVIVLLMLAMSIGAHKPAAVIPEERMTALRANIAAATLCTEVELPIEYLGRFYIPAVGVDVACYRSSAQSVADAADSAAYFFACGHDVIADHVNQGFGAIKGCKIGDGAQLVTAEGTEHYTCVGLIQGHNTGIALTDLAYNPIDDMYPDTLVCYTCNDNWRNVTIVFFARD